MLSTRSFTFIVNSVYNSTVPIVVRHGNYVLNR